MNPTRGALLAATVCTLPFVVWAAGSLWLQAVSDVWQPQFLNRGVEAMWLAQGLVLAVLLPTHVGQRTSTAAVAGMVVFVLTPLPILAVAWLLGALPIHSMAAAVSSLGVAAVMAALAVRRLFDCLPGPGLLPVATVLTQLALVGVGLVVAVRWIAWIEP